MFMGMAVICILLVMIVPLPFFLLDILMVLSIAFSVLVLMLVITMSKPLEFSSFPTLLLLLTLLRLSLNVASTRLILLNGINFDGKVIKAFGNFVVGGNYVVGAVVFLILFIVQLMVITKGSQRIAEVAARFTLDAMPGKQMAIDADLNAGIIDEKEALVRRRETAGEADFYGAMDGASKFVRGDAIACVIITIINIVGGFIIGIFQQNLPALQALQIYGVYTIGDGLAAQIPSLLVSIASGIIVTRAASGTGAGLAEQMGIQLLSRPKPLIITSVFLCAVGLIPGIPKVPFLFVGGILAIIAYNLNQNKQAEELKEKAIQEKESMKQQVAEPVEDLLQVDCMEIEIGYGLIPLADVGGGGNLLDKISALRRQCATELGMIVPPIRIRDNMRIDPNGYVIKLRGSVIAQGSCMPGYYLAMSSDAQDESLVGIKTHEPAFGLPALWISENQKSRAEELGYTVVDAITVVTTHLVEVIKRHAHEILGRQEVKNLLDNLKKTYPALVDEVVPNLLSIGAVQKVLQNLLRENIPVRDLVTILEVLGDYGVKTKDADILTEYSRHALARTITSKHKDDSGKMKVITLDPHLEELMGNAIKRSQDMSYVALDPKIIQEILSKTADEIRKGFPDGSQPVVLCSPQVRSHFKRLTERTLPNLSVLSFNEIDHTASLESMGMVEVN
jgi:flagellar biosynthesis protein FlhA